MKAKKIKKKKINLTLEIDARFRWIAVQPWGEVMAFTHKPEIFLDKDEDTEGRVGYWQRRTGTEETITQHGGDGGFWKLTLKKI